MARVLVLMACIVVGGVVLGCAVDKQYSQTQLNAIETREFAAGYDQTFDAAVGALFDLGYSIHASDKRGGVIAAYGNTYGGGVQLKLDQAGARLTRVRVSTSSGGQVRVDEKTIDKVLDQIERQLTAGAPSPQPGGQ